MTDAEWLLAFVALIYLSECVVWLPRDAVAVVIPLRGRAVVRLPSTWAGNDRGAFAFTTLLPARAVFRCEPHEPARLAMREIDERVAGILRRTTALHRLSVAIFFAMFVLAPLVSLRLGFARIGLILLAVFLVLNVTASIVFARTFARVDPSERLRRIAYSFALLVSTPSAARAVDQITMNALQDFDPLAVAARLAGEDDPVVQRLLRELAHPPGGAPRGARHEALRGIGLVHRERPPVRTGDASAYCPRCLVQYGAGNATCRDCEVSLQPLEGMR